MNFDKKLAADYDQELTLIDTLAAALGVTLPARPVHNYGPNHVENTARLRVAYRLECLTALVTAAQALP